MQRCVQINSGILKGLDKISKESETTDAWLDLSDTALNFQNSRQIEF